MAKKTTIIKHPTVSIKDLEKNGKKIDKKSRTTGVKQRVIDLLKTNTDKGIALTQRQIRECLNNEVREQHINNILHSLVKDNKVVRYEHSVVCDDGIRRDLMFNSWKK